MKALFTLILFSIVANSSIASQPRLANIYKQYSENEQFYLRAIPFSKFPNGPGITQVYRVGVAQPIYTSNQFCDREIYLSDNGSMIVTLNPRIFCDVPMPTIEQKIVRIYFDGKLKSELSIKEINPDAKLINKSEIITWLHRTFVHLDTMYIMTSENISVLLSMKSGKIISRRSNEDVRQQFRTTAPVIQCEYELLKFACSEQECIPSMLNGKGLDSAFSNFMKQELKTQAKAIPIGPIAYQVLVDRSGACRLLDISVESDKVYSDFSIFKSKCRNWMNRQKVITNIIPEQCDRWTYTAYAFL